VAKLIVVGGKSPAAEYELTEESTTIGRHPSQHIQLLDRLVSKGHATIERQGEDFVLVDGGSRNGSFINTRLVSESVTLQDNDKLLLGSTRLVFLAENKRKVSTTMTRVTIDREPMHSAIAAKVSHRGAHEFAAEKDVTEEKELRQDYEKLRMAHLLQREIALEVDLDHLLRKIMDSLFNTLECDRGAILLIDPETSRLETHFVKSRADAKDKKPAHPTEEINISHTIIDQVCKDKTAVLSSDARVDSRFAGAESVILQGIRSTMCVPLISHNSVLGVIHLDSLFASGAFNERDLNVVQSLAHQAAIAIENSMLVRQREHDAHIRAKFSRLLSPNLVDQLVEGKLAIEKGGTTRRSTVLFSDLRGFTEMSQRSAPEETVHMLNEYFEIMVDIVFDYKGTLDKFMGDGIMAVWGAPVDMDDGPEMAVRAGLAMQQALTEFNDVRVSEGLEELRMGVGVDTGDLVAGYMGSTKTMNYTVIGPPVNRASRLCDVAKPQQTLISEATLKLLPSTVQYQALEPVALKGIAQPVTPYNILSL
jgi:adenylate cyclase